MADSPTSKFFVTWLFAMSWPLLTLTSTFILSLDAATWAEWRRNPLETLWSYISIVSALALATLLTAIAHSVSLHRTKRRTVPVWASSLIVFLSALTFTAVCLGFLWLTVALSERFGWINPYDGVFSTFAFVAIVCSGFVYATLPIVIVPALEWFHVTRSNLSRLRTTHGAPIRCLECGSANDFHRIGLSTRRSEFRTLIMAMAIMAGIVCQWLLAIQFARSTGSFPWYMPQGPSPYHEYAAVVPLSFVIGSPHESTLRDNATKYKLDYTFPSLSNPLTGIVQIRVLDYGGGLFSRTREFGWPAMWWSTHTWECYDDPRSATGPRPIQASTPGFTPHGWQIEQSGSLVPRTINRANLTPNGVFEITRVYPLNIAASIGLALFMVFPLRAAQFAWRRVGLSRLRRVYRTAASRCADCGHPLPI